MKLPQWSCVVLSVLCTLHVAEARNASTAQSKPKWISFDPSVKSVPENKAPTITMPSVPAAGMIIGPDTKALFDPRNGRYIDQRSQRNVDLTQDRNVVFVDPNTCTLVKITVPGMFSQPREEVVGLRDGSTSRMAFDELTIPGCGTLPTIGEPGLPVFGRFVQVPPDADPSSIRLSIVDWTYRRLSYENPVYPTQPPEPREQDPNKEPIVINWDKYESGEYYLKNMVEMRTEEMGYVGEHQFVFLRVYPVGYNHAKGYMVGYKQLEVALTYARSDPNEASDRSIAAQSFAQLPPAATLNNREVEQSPRTHDLPATVALGEEAKQWPDYLILTPDVFYNSKDPGNGIVRLAEWKRRKGYVTRVVTLADVRGQNGQGDIQAEDIKEYLQNIYDCARNAHKAAPKYVLLVGDTGDDTGKVLLPTYYGSIWRRKFNDGGMWSYYYYKVGTDLYYATLSNRADSFYPDLCVGRLSVDTLEQANIVIDKILAYEMLPPASKDYYVRIPLVQLFEDDRDRNGKEDTGFRIIGHAERIAQYLIRQGYEVQRIYDESYPENDSPSEGGPQDYRNLLEYETDSNLPEYLPLPESLKLPDYPWDGNTPDILAAMDKGCCLLAYNGHGGRTNWGRPAFAAADFARLTNGALTPVVLSVACETGWFDNETDFFDRQLYFDKATGVYEFAPNTADVSEFTPNTEECFCERLLRQPGGGAVAVIGSSRISFEANDSLIYGMFGAIWPGLMIGDPFSIDPDLVPGNSTNGAWRRMGQINTYAKFYMGQKWADQARMHFELYNLLGDPEMPIWIGEPNDLVVVHQAAANARGPQDAVEVSVHVADKGNPVAGATVVLTYPGRDILFRQTTSPEGYARFTLEGLGNELKAVPWDLTVTAPNCRPHMGTIQVK